MNRSASPKPPLVLVVDDDPTNRVMVQAALRGAGFSTLLAGDGREALDAFSAHHPDIVLLDIMMPVMDGYEALAALRSDPAGRYLPVIMMTGMDDTDSVKNAYAMGATDFVNKPVNYLLLTYRVEHLLQASRTAGELRKSEERFSNAQRIARLGHWEWNCNSGMVFCSEGIRDIYAAPDVDPFQRLDEFLDMVHADDVDTVRRTLDVGNRERRNYQLNYRIELPDGTQRHLFHECNFDERAGGQADTVIGTVQDVTERHKAEQEIHFLSHFDKLTNLPNRTLFTQHLQHAIAISRRRGKETIVLFLDLDRFNRFNDTLGRPAGDELLKQIAGRLSACVRESDMVGRDLPAEPLPGDDINGGAVARFGGDDFVIMLNNVNSAEDAIFVVKRIRKALQAPFSIAGEELHVSASIGISAYPLDGDQPEVLLKHAEDAMLHAKRQGSDQIQFYTASLNNKTRKKFRIENDLRKAIDRGEIDVYYQPKVRLRDDCVVGVEALARWHCEGTGPVSPGEFIPVAEESGLILPLSQSVLMTACTQVGKWQEQGLDKLTVSVNVSPIQFRQTSLANDLRALQQRSGLACECIELELTESLLFEDTQRSKEVLTALGAEGFRVALDDFGTGYSSYNHLKLFPLHTLKIDKSFVRNMANDVRDAAIVNSIIVLGHSLGLSVVAEGVQDARQLHILDQYKCNTVQGYYYAPALTSAQFFEWTTSRFETAELPTPGNATRPIRIVQTID